MEITLMQTSIICEQNCPRHRGSSGHFDFPDKLDRPRPLSLRIAIANSFYHRRKRKDNMHRRLYVHFRIRN